MTCDCSQNADPLKLVREGTSQGDRLLAVLDPGNVPVSVHSVANEVVFAQDYAALLKFFNDQNLQDGDWAPFFASDVSVQLAVAAIEDVEVYKANVKSSFDYLNDSHKQSNPTELKNQLGYLYDYAGTLAQGLDALKEGLPAEVPLKGILQNLIHTQLAPAFNRLVSYYDAGVNATPSLVNVAVPNPAPLILRRKVVTLASVLDATLSADWGVVQGTDASVYGDSTATVFAQINHCATHNMFTSVFDQFLKVFSRVVSEANGALAATLTNWNKHEPHYALYLAFLRLLEYARTLSNTLTQRHLDFYYRRILGFAEKPAEPSRVHLLAELAKQTTSRDFQVGELFKAGKDDQGHDVFFANDSDFVANQAKVAALQTVYRHTSEPVKGSTVDQGRLYASPVANSDDGLGAPLTSVTQSWHPFFNKIYGDDGALSEIRMPQANIGFAVASHYLWMAEGTRTILAVIAVEGYTGALLQDLKDDIRCFVTTEKGWLEKPPAAFFAFDTGTFLLAVQVAGGDAPITPYSGKAHGYTFQTDLPVLLVRLKQDDTRPYAYPTFQDVTVTGINLIVWVQNVKSLAVSNDYGPVDSSKAFQPFGPSPATGSSLTLGSNEIFQKELTSASVNIGWLAPPKAYPPTAPTPQISIDFLKDGQWSNGAAGVGVDSTTFDSSQDASLNPNLTVRDAADFSANEPYGTQSRQGFVRLRLNGGFGQDAYQADLISYLGKSSTTPPGKAPVGPTANALSMDYAASSELVLNASTADSYAKRPGQFFHLAPFGTAERHAYLSGGKPVPLFPQFDFQRNNATLQSEAEFYIGIDGLAPPQNLSLLFETDPGTANPLVAKPKPHIDWCYLKDNEWIEFTANEVQDSTAELLNSGIITLAVPRDATKDNTLLPAGLFWVRAAVQKQSDAVCDLQRVAAQAMQASFVDRGNSPNFSATPLPAGTIKKLDVPDAAVKSISQPFASFGGRAAEQSNAFYTRVSERLRHKGRAIDLWDYERLILEQFPQIYKVKCLNHTHFEESTYRELAPGHVTIVAIPNLRGQDLRDPLKPYTSLDVLQQIETFLQGRTGCFVQLHVKNPQFEEVRAKFRLRLYDGRDETYYSNLLKQEITHFLSPWAFSAGQAPSFGGKIYKSVLIDFVEKRPYVDYVTDFQLFHDIDVPGTVDLDEIAGSRAVSVLVSAPAGKHEITIIDAAAATASVESCLCEV